MPSLRIQEKVVPFLRVKVWVPSVRYTMPAALAKGPVMIATASSYSSGSSSSSRWVRQYSPSREISWLPAITSLSYTEKMG
jgi:hypothetical protein